MEKLKPEIMERIKKERAEKFREVQIPLYVPELSIQPEEKKEEKKEKKPTTVLTIDLVD